MGRKKSAEIVSTRRFGNVTVDVRRYGRRFGFDYRRSTGERAQVLVATLEQAIERADQYARTLSAGRLDVIDTDPRELAEFRQWRAERGKSAATGAVVEEYLRTKRADSGLNPGYVLNLGYALKPFVAAFPSHIGEITPAQIETWLASLNQTPVTRNNARAVLVSLFRFARQREYLPDRTTAAEKIKKLRVRRDERHIEIRTPDELRAIMDAARSEYVPWLALEAFSTIRTEEISPKNSSKSRLRWSDFKWSEKVIAVRGATSKTGRPRHVPIHPTLALWLAPWRRATGDVMPDPLKYQLEIARLKSLGFTWKKNALRHTAISCRLAVVKNAAQVAEESGNSVEMIRRTYHHPVTMATARAWYAVKPTVPANVVRMRA